VCCILLATPATSLQHAALAVAVRACKLRDARRLARRYRMATHWDSLVGRQHSLILSHLLYSWLRERKGKGRARENDGITAELAPLPLALWRR